MKLQVINLILASGVMLFNIITLPVLIVLLVKVIKSVNQQDNILSLMSKQFFKLQNIEQKVYQPSENKAPVTPEPMVDNDISYKYAQKIIKSGGSVDEIMENCQMSRAEAELLMAMNAVG